MVSFWLASTALLGMSAATAIHSQNAYKSSTSTPLPPSKDPFYTAPFGYELVAPGTILRRRNAPGNLTLLVGNCSAAYNILYRTSDSLEQPSWAVTTLLIPETKSSYDSKTALLSYQMAYDSADVDDSPSYTMYSSVEPDIPNALGQGWFVSVPDFEGPSASYAAGLASGRATLDSVRAILSSNYGLSCESTRYAMWGYSGGALASEWATELQNNYAPELRFSGAALGGLTPNITSVLYSVNGSIYVGLVPSAVVGLASQHLNFEKLLLEGLKPSGTYNKSGFLEAKYLSVDQAADYYNGQNIFDYFMDGAAWFMQPEVKLVTDSEGNMGYHGIPNMPIFAYKAIHDTLSVISDTDALVEKYCDQGVSILYSRNTIGGHEAESLNGDPAAFRWLTSVFDGTLNQTDCMTENVTVSISALPY